MSEDDLKKEINLLKKSVADLKFGVIVTFFIVLVLCASILSLNARGAEHLERISGPSDWVGWALSDIAQLQESDRPFVRYLAIPSWGSEKWVPALNFTVNTAWCISDNPPSNRLDLVRVLTHELGHGLGVSHLGEQSGCLMAPFYSSRIGWPQPGDIAEVVARYGPPVEQPKQPEIPTTPEGEAELLRIISKGGRVVVRFADGREVTA